MACMGDEAGSHGSLGRSGYMTPRGVDFLENWIATSISSDAKPDQAKALAAHCTSDAAALGISREDMEGKWGSVAPSGKR